MLFNISDSDLDAILDRTPDVWKELSGGRVFLTGGTGFVGRWLLASILRANKRLDADIWVVVMSRDPAGFLAEFPEGENSHISFHCGDLRYSIFPSGEFSHVVHAASYGGAVDRGDPIQVMDSIVWGTRRVLNFAVHGAKARRLLYLSTSAVYGCLPDGVTTYSEDLSSAPLPQDPASLIGNAHRMAEQMCSLFHQQYGLETKVARCILTANLSVSDDGTSANTYLYGADFTVWLWRILIDGQADHPYNMGSDHARTAQDVVPCFSRARKELGLDVWTPLDAAIGKIVGGLDDVVRTTPRSNPPQSKTYVVDIDGVLASITPGNDYNLAQPLDHMIKRINELYDSGHRIILFTARGSATGLDWREVTQRQMQAWGVKHHELHMGKPAADHYIDDRMLPLELL